MANTLTYRNSDPFLDVTKCTGHYSLVGGSNTLDPAWYRFLFGGSDY